MPLLAFLAFGVFTRRAVTRTFEMHVALSARAAVTKNKFLAVDRKIDKRLDCGLRIANCGLISALINCFCVGRWTLDARHAVDRRGDRRRVGRWTFSAFFINPQSAIRTPQLINDRPNRYLHDFIWRRASIHILALPMTSAFRLDDRFVEKVRKVIDV